MPIQPLMKTSAPSSLAYERKSACFARACSGVSSVMIVTRV
jgi:hypothetical protein